MLAGIEARLLGATGDGLATWAARLRDAGSGTGPEVRAWPAERGITGYAQMVLFGYPDFLTATAGELIEGQYADRPALRPVLDTVLAAAAGEEHVQARKGYVTPVGPRRTYAVGPATGWLP